MQNTMNPRGYSKKAAEVQLKHYIQAEKEMHQRTLQMHERVLYFKEILKEIKENKV